MGPRLRAAATAALVILVGLLIVWSSPPSSVLTARTPALTERAEGATRALVPSLPSTRDVPAAVGPTQVRPGANGTPTGQWTNLTGNLSVSPPAEYGWASTYDPLSASVVLFGGCGYSLQTGCLNETWSYNASGGWVELDNGSGPSPSARQGPGMAFDPVMGAVILFGGDHLGTSLSDTWEWKAGSWRDLTASLNGSPPARFDSAMVWDPPVDALVLYGGSQWDSATWEFNGTWHQVVTPASPPATSWEGLTYDAYDGYVLLGPGQDAGFGPMNETWKFNGTNWTQLSPTLSPPAEQQAVLTYDSVGGYALLTPLGTDQTWAYRAGQWFNLTPSLAVRPPPRGLPAMAMDEADGVVILFGGAYGTPSGQQIGTCPPCLTDTWAWTATTLQAAASPSPADVGVPVGFHVVDPGTGTPPLSYSWEFGDGSSGVGRNLSHAFAAPGAFVAMVWVNDSLGNSSNATVPLTVNAYPNVTAAAAPSLVDAGSPVDFAAAVAGGTAPFRYWWEFGDGANSTASAPTHVFVSNGTFTINVTVRDAGGGVGSASASVTVNPPLRVVNLTAAPNSSGLGQPVNFSAEVLGGTPPYAYSWTFGDGGTGGNLQNITHIFATDGQFVTTVAVRDATGDSATDSIPMNISLEVGLFATFSSLPVGQLTDVEPVITGGKAPYSITWPGLPAWCAPLGSAAPGEIGCVPPSAGVFGISVRVVDSKGAIGTASLTLLVHASGAPGVLSPGLPVLEGIGIAAVAGLSFSAVTLLGGYLIRRGQRRIERLRELPPAEAHSTDSAAQERVGRRR